MDVESGAAGGTATVKTLHQTVRDAVLFTFAAGVSFGPCWYGALTLFEVLFGRDTEPLFAGAALSGALLLAVCHEALFTCVHRLESSCGGRIVYKIAQGTSFKTRTLFVLWRDEIGGILFLGLAEAAVAAFPVTQNKLALVARVSGSFFLGFAAWGVFIEWLHRTVPSAEAETSSEADEFSLKRLLLDLAFKFCTVFLVPYTNRFSERSFDGLGMGPAYERFVVAFVANAFFIVLWFRFYDLSHCRWFRA